MKRLMMLALVLVLVFSAAAFADEGGEERDFGIFKTYVPNDWTATQEGPTVSFLKNDNTSHISVTIAATEGASAKELVDAFVAEFSKTFTDITEPQVDEDGDYMFEMTNPNGVKSAVLFSADEKEYCLFVMTGVDNGGAGLAQIIAGIQNSFNQNK